MTGPRGVLRGGILSGITLLLKRLLELSALALFGLLRMLPAELLRMLPGAPSVTSVTSEGESIPTTPTVNFQAKRTIYTILIAGYQTIRQFLKKGVGKTMLFINSLIRVLTEFSVFVKRLANGKIPTVNLVENLGNISLPCLFKHGASVNAASVKVECPLHLPRNVDINIIPVTD